MKNIFYFFTIFIICSIVRSNEFFDVFMPENEVDQFLRSGGMKGYFKAKEFWEFFENIRNDARNRRHISDKIEVGKTYEGRTLFGYYIGENVRELSTQLQSKNIIFITGVHHSREPLTLTMVMLMTIELLKRLRDNGHNHFLEMFRDNVVFFIPIVNTDSYIFINENWQNKARRNEVMMIRKNRHISPECTIYTGGVDLNRNYDFKFGMNESGSSSNPCQEDYRGLKPFSEPETYAIKMFVDEHPNIVSGVNIHSYGNAWIYPFNFVSDGGDDLLKKKKTLFFDFYKEFEADMHAKDHKALFGNAAFTLDYPTNGEAGDWMTGAKNILNLDVELGNLDKESDAFYPPVRLIDRIVRYNMIIMNDFLLKHTVDFSLKKVILNPNIFSINFEIFNKAVSSLIEFEGFIKPFFRHNHTGKNYKFEYSIKNLLEDAVEPIPIIGNIISTTIKGRHILDLQIRFENKEDYQEFEALHMVIKRHGEEQYRDFPNQKYTFKVAKNKKKI
jgi:hypothetical protein